MYWGALGRKKTKDWQQMLAQVPIFEKNKESGFSNCYSFLIQLFLRSLYIGILWFAYNVSGWISFYLYLWIFELPEYEDWLLSSGLGNSEPLSLNVALLTLMLSPSRALAGTCSILSLLQVVSPLSFLVFVPLICIMGNSLNLFSSSLFVSSASSKIWCLNHLWNFYF